MRGDKKNPLAICEDNADGMNLVFSTIVCGIFNMIL